LKIRKRMRGARAIEKIYLVVAHWPPPWTVASARIRAARGTTPSHYSYLFTVGNGPVSWKLKRSTIVAYSTLEAEFTGFMEGNREAL